MRPHATSQRRAGDCRGQTEDVCVVGGGQEPQTEQLMGERQKVQTVVVGGRDGNK